MCSVARGSGGRHAPWHACPVSDARPRTWPALCHLRAAHGFRGPVAGKQSHSTELCAPGVLGGSKVMQQNLQGSCAQPHPGYAVCSALMTGFLLRVSSAGTEHPQWLTRKCGGPRLLAAAARSVCGLGPCCLKSLPLCDAVSSVWSDTMIIHSLKGLAQHFDTVCASNPLQGKSCGCASGRAAPSSVLGRGKCIRWSSMSCMQNAAELRRNVRNLQIGSILSRGHLAHTTVFLVFLRLDSLLPLPPGLLVCGIIRLHMRASC